jgi:hypothetical protein
MAVRRYKPPVALRRTSQPTTRRNATPRAPGVAPGGRAIGGAPRPTQPGWVKTPTGSWVKRPPAGSRQLAPATPSTAPPAWGGIQAPAAPQAPQAQVTPSPAPASAPPPEGAVVDSAYLAWRAGREAEMAQQRIAYDTADKTESQTRTEALRRLALQRPEALQNADVSANRRGLFYSTGLGKQKDTIQADFTQRAADTNQRFEVSRAGREAARMALVNGFSVEDAAQLAAAADRKIQRDQDAANANALAINPVDGEVAPEAAAPVAAPAPRAVAGTPQKTTSHRATAIRHGSKKKRK